MRIGWLSSPRCCDVITAVASSLDALGTGVPVVVVAVVLEMGVDAGMVGAGVVVGRAGDGGAAGGWSHYGRPSAQRMVMGMWDE